jgi:hypothetical protein
MTRCFAIKPASFCPGRVPPYPHRNGGEGSCQRLLSVSRGGVRPGTLPPLDRGHPPNQRPGWIDAYSWRMLASPAYWRPQGEGKGPSLSYRHLRPEPLARWEEAGLRLRLPRPDTFRAAATRLLPG